VINFPLPIGSTVVIVEGNSVRYYGCCSKTRKNLENSGGLHLLCVVQYATRSYYAC
jgi:hypothetical protein